MIKVWQTAAMLFAITTALLFGAWIWSPQHSGASPTTGFPNMPLSPKLVQRRFAWALHAKPNGTLSAFEGTSTPRYVGDPSPVIDKAWEDLIGDRYFRLLDSEIGRLDEDIDLPNLEPLPTWKNAVDQSGVYGGIDMMHSLHCVNSLRRQLDHAYYAGNEMILLPGETPRLHLDHCLEQLRQAVLCHVDTTPVTLRPIVSRLGDGQNVLTMLGETERLHTCRDAEPVLRWVKEQAASRGHV